VRVHVISDMEGVAGIVKWQQTTGGEKLYDEGRVLYTEEIGRPCEIAIDFTTPDRLQEFANRKGVEVTGASSLVVRGDDWWAAWSSFFF